jgi:hypothetical protein
MNESSSYKMLLKVMDNPSPVAFALMLTVNRHLPYLCFGIRESYRDDASNQISALVKQTEVQLLSFLVEIFIVEAQRDRHTQYLIAKLAFPPEVV